MLNIHETMEEKKKKGKKRGKAEGNARSDRGGNLPFIKMLEESLTEKGICGQRLESREQAMHTSEEGGRHKQSLQMPDV